MVGQWEDEIWLDVEEGSENERNKGSGRGDCGCLSRSQVRCKHCLEVNYDGREVGGKTLVGGGSRGWEE